jgi:midasin (ATPase involved in ribosome maturation)
MDTEETNGVADLKPKESTGKIANQFSKMQVDEKTKAQDDEMNVDEHQTESESLPTPILALNDIRSASETVPTSLEVSAESEFTMDPDQLRAEMEAEVAQWRSSPASQQDAETARRLWSKYDRLTHDLSLELCEQLRLILEPTLATKLKGDYRTGKRLNMKKIVPYIASQYKKDKIWMRRTKPSKRQYQVLIAVDDSKSMAESRSVQLAYESLALIAKALTQLEVGYDFDFLCHADFQ